MKYELENLGRNSTFLAHFPPVRPWQIRSIPYNVGKVLEEFQGILVQLNHVPSGYFFVHIFPIFLCAFL